MHSSYSEYIYHRSRLFSLHTCVLLHKFSPRRRRQKREERAPLEITSPPSSRDGGYAKSEPQNVFISFWVVVFLPSSFPGKEEKQSHFRLRSVPRLSRLRPPQNHLLFLIWEEHQVQSADSTTIRRLSLRDEDDFEDEEKCFGRGEALCSVSSTHDVSTRRGGGGGGGKPWERKKRGRRRTRTGSGDCARFTAVDGGRAFR